MKVVTVQKVQIFPLEVCLFVLTQVFHYDILHQVAHFLVAVEPVAEAASKTS